ncbi:MAG: FmdB family zinc ribbon protein [Microbacteriaceae bacterium]
MRQATANNEESRARPVPTYAYKCRVCGTAFDVHQAFSDDALTVCPSCGGVLRKVFGTVGVTFNGSGFYRTDSRASNANLAAAKDKKHKKGTKEPAAASASGGASSSVASAPSTASAPSSTSGTSSAS